MGNPDPKLCWQTLLSQLQLREGLHPSDVIGVLRVCRKDVIVTVQINLKHSGKSTEAFVADGDVGEETEKSIRLLWEAAGSP